MTSITKTFCRICDPHCPLDAHVDDDGNLLSLKPDKAHPVSKGYACHKGLKFDQVNQDPDRLNDPQRRTNSRQQDVGEFEDISWDEAFAEIGKKLTAIINEHGPDAVATYMGNPVVLNSRALALAATIRDIIGTKYSFSASTQDTINKFAAALHIYGGNEVTIPDLKNTDFLINFGSNPRVSRGTIYYEPNPMEGLKKIKARGGRVLFVNPRKIESATKDTGDVLLVKPDTDIYLMAALLCELDKLGAFQDEIIARQGKHIEGLRAFVSRYPADRVADVVGVSAETIVQLAKDIAAAKSVAFHMGTGVNQGRQGTLAFWLLNMLTFVTGNFGRKGGSYKPMGSVVPEQAPIEPVETPVGSFIPVLGDLPGNILADVINAPERPIRALINLSGNPLITMSGEDKLRDAFKKLDVIVSIDLYRSDTCEMSDYVLPATDWLEREDINVVQIGGQLKPYVQYTPRVVEPAGNRKNDWWIISQLCEAIGKPTPLSDPDKDGWEIIEMGLQAIGLSLAEVKSAPDGTLVLPEVEEHATTFERLVLHKDKKIDCCPAFFEEAMAKTEDILEQLSSESGEALKLISLRTRNMHNSWLTNMPQMRKGRYATNGLNMHPDDAEKRGLENGQKIRVFNDHGQIETELVFNDTLRPGVVAMTHGYGHRHAPALSLASQNPGANSNRLLPVGSGSFEKLSGMSWMNGVVVEVAAWS